MLDCLIIGDSLAVGVGQYSPTCSTYAKIGITSKSWNSTYGKRVYPNTYKTVVISLGTNDFSGIKTVNELTNIRQNIKAERVIWILPSNKVHNIQTIVRNVAQQFNDAVLSNNAWSADGFHPTPSGYKLLSKRIK